MTKEKVFFGIFNNMRSNTINNGLVYFSLSILEMVQFFLFLEALLITTGGDTRGDEIYFNLYYLSSSYHMRKMCFVPKCDSNLPSSSCQSNHNKRKFFFGGTNTCTFTVYRITILYIGLGCLLYLSHYQKRSSLAVIWQRCNYAVAFFIHLFAKTLLLVSLDMLFLRYSLLLAMVEKTNEVPLIIITLVIILSLSFLYVGYFLNCTRSHYYLQTNNYYHEKMNILFKFFLSLVLNFKQLSKFEGYGIYLAFICLVIYLIYMILYTKFMFNYFTTKLERLTYYLNILVCCFVLIKILAFTIAGTKPEENPQLRYIWEIITTCLFCAVAIIFYWRMKEKDEQRKLYTNQRVCSFLFMTAEDLLNDKDIKDLQTGPEYNNWIKYINSLKFEIHEQNAYFDLDLKEDLNLVYDRIMYFNKNPIIDIMIYFLTDGNILRSSYYLKNLLQPGKFDLKTMMILKHIEEKFKNISNNKQVDNIIIIKHIELTEKFREVIKVQKNLIKLSKQCNIYTDKTDVVQFINDNYYKFGLVHSDIQTRMVELFKHFKIKNSSHYYHCLSLYNLIFNAEFKNETVIENIDYQNYITALYKKNTNFILEKKEGKLLIKTVPLNYMHKLGIAKPKILKDQDYFNIFPDIMRNREREMIETKLIQSENFEISTSSLIVNKENYVIKVNLRYFILPVIGNQHLIGCEMEIPEEKNIIIINEYGDFAYFSCYFGLFFGINPSMITNRLNLNIYDLFNIERTNVHGAFTLKPKQDCKKELTKVNLNIARYLKVFAKMCQINDDSIISHRPCFQDSMLIHSNHQTPMEIPIEFESIDDFQSFSGSAYHIFHVRIGPTIFEQNVYQRIAKKTKFPSTLQDVKYNEHLLEIQEDSFASQMAKSTQYKSQLETKRKISKFKSSGLVGWVATIYNYLMIFLAIFILIYIREISSNLNGYFNLLENWRSVSALYQNNLMHISNKLIPYGLNANTDYRNHSLTEFYISEFIEHTDEIFEKFKMFKKDLSTKVRQHYLDTELSFKFNATNLNGITTEEDFLENLDLQINNIYTFVDNKDYYFVFNLSYPNVIDYDASLEFTKIMNQYKEVTGHIMEFDTKICSLYQKEFSSYKYLVYILFSLFILAHSFLYCLYYYEINVYSQKILKVYKDIQGLNNQQLETLNIKFKLLKQLLECSVDPNKLFCKLNKLNISSLKKTDNVYESKGKIEIKLFTQTKRWLSILYSIYVLIFFIGVATINLFIQKLNSAWDYNLGIVTTQRHLYDFSLSLRFSVVLNDTNFISTNMLDEHPRNIYNNLFQVEKLIENDSVFVNLLTLFGSFKVGSTCSQIKENNNQEYYDIYQSMCNKIIIDGVHLDILINSFVENARRDYIEFLHSDRSWETINSMTFSKSIQDNSLLYFFFLEDFFKKSRSFGIYKKNIDTLLTFDIVLFVILIVTEIANFILTKYIIMNRIKRGLHYHILFHSCQQI